MRTHLAPAAIVATFALAALLPAQLDEAARRELDHVFDRPAGTVIKDEQKAKLAAWLQAHDGVDLGDLGYAKALRLYLDRDYTGAVAQLDAFFGKHTAIANDEHRNMAGRVFLNAVSTEVRAEKPRTDELARWCEQMTRLYRDTAMIERMAKALLARSKDPAPLRVAMSKGVFASDLTVAQKDSFLQSLYAAAPAAAAGAAPAAAPPAVPAPPAVSPAVAAPQFVGKIDVPPPPRAKKATAQLPEPNKILEVGQTVEPFALERVINGSTGFDLASCRGKVLVLDFFSSWCPPCRASLPSMVQLQKDHPNDVQVIGVTRYYGRGTDFSADGATADTGTTASGLDREHEAALYPPLVKVFAVNDPIVFPADQDLARQRFGVTGIPAMFVVGRDGTLVGSVVGSGDESHKQLLELVEKARK